MEDESRKTPINSPTGSLFIRLCDLCKTEREIMHRADPDIDSPGIILSGLLNTYVFCAQRFEYSKESCEKSLEDCWNLMNKEDLGNLRKK